jgi:cytochrome c oxidase assembly protein subunit 15
LEWAHRAVALTVGIAIVAAFVLGWRVRRTIAGVAPTLLALVAIFVLQVVVGGVTIHESNSPRSVVLHWAVAMALLAALVVLALLAFAEPRPGGTSTAAPAFAPLAVALVLAYATMCVGSYVSSSGAGLACPAFPSCDGTFVGSTPPQVVQMLHRLLATAFVLAALVAAWAARAAAPRARAWAYAGAALAVLQLALGVANVLWRMPTALREAHAANAAVTFLAFVIATTLTGLSARRAVRLA